MHAPITTTMDPALDWAERTLRGLNRRERIAQTAQERLAGFSDDRPETIAAYFAANPLGSLFVGGEIIRGAGRSARAYADAIRRCQRASKVPLLIAGDLERGAGGAVAGLTEFPDMMALGAADEESLAYEYGKWTALEGRAAGFNWTFAPVVDLLLNWLNPVVTTRSLGSDAGRVAALASALVQGMQDHALAACAKHFPGDGVDFRDQHLVTSVNSLPESAWRETFGQVFGAVIGVGVHSIMSGHIALPWLEPFEAGQARPRPATVSRRVQVELLRGQLGFRGVLVSDALEMAGFTGWATREERTLAAFNAGVDVMLWPGPGYVEIMERALDAGRVTGERLDESVRRILTLKARLGLANLQGGHDPAAPTLRGAEMPPEITLGAQTLSRELATRSITLVRNRRGLLPLDAARIRRLLVLKAVNPIPGLGDKMDGLLRRLAARGFELTVLENVNCLEIQSRERAGERWDAFLAVFSLGMHHLKNTVRPVGGMAESIWTLQNVETLPPVVVSLATPFLLWDLPFLDTLVNTHSAQDASLEALDRALFGETPFQNHSPVDAECDWSAPGFISPRSGD